MRKEKEQGKSLPSFSQQVQQIPNSGMWINPVNQEGLITIEKIKE